MHPLTPRSLRSRRPSPRRGEGWTAGLSQIRGPAMKRALAPVSLLSLTLSFALFAENATKPLGDPVLEAPTLHSLGVYWIVQGDDNQNAVVEMEFREKGSKESTK